MKLRLANIFRHKLTNRILTRRHPVDTKTTVNDEKKNLQTGETQPGTSIMMSVRPNKAVIIQLRDEWYRELEAQQKIKYKKS